MVRDYKSRDYKSRDYKSRDYKSRDYKSRDYKSRPYTIAGLHHRAFMPMHTYLFLSTYI